MSRSQVFTPHRRRASRRLSRASVALTPIVLCALGYACGTNNNYYETQYVYPAQGEAGRPSKPPVEHEHEDAGTDPSAEADAGATADAGDQGPDDGLPRVDTDAQALAVDVFGAPG